MSCDIYQQVYLLVLLSNDLFNCQGMSLAALLQQIQKDTPKNLAILEPQIGDNWSVVWGPTVWQNPGSTKDTADNTWVVFHNPSATIDGEDVDTYVVAIAGTGRYSTYDLNTEDLAVGQVVDFVSWSKNWSTGVATPTALQPPSDSPAIISMGTATGLYNLLSTQSPTGPENLLVDYLERLPPAARIIFAGHSLGGALAPSLALGLVSNNILPNAKNAYVFASAGPSPGNEAFVELYSSYFPFTPPQSGDPAYAAWNGNFWHKYDVVPQAFSRVVPAQNLKNIPTLWNNTLAVQAELKVILNTYVYPRLNQSSPPVAYCPLPGASFGAATPPLGPTSADIQTILAFGLVQHGKAYTIEFNVTPAPFACPPAGNSEQKGWGQLRMYLTAIWRMAMCCFM